VTVGEKKLQNITKAWQHGCHKRAYFLEDTTKIKQYIQKSS